MATSILYNKFVIIIIVCNFNRENLYEKKKMRKTTEHFINALIDWLTVKYRKFNNGLPNEEEWKSIIDEDASVNYNSMCSSSDLPTVSVIEEGRIDEKVESEGCEGDYDDLYMHASSNA